MAIGLQCMEALKSGACYAFSSRLYHRCAGKSAYTVRLNCVQQTTIMHDLLAHSVQLKSGRAVINLSEVFFDKSHSQWLKSDLNSYDQ